MITSRTLAHTVLELAKKPDAEKQFDVFLDYLKENNLMGLLPQVLRHIHRFSLQSHELNTVHVATRYSLSDKELASISKIIGAGSSPIIQHIDQTVIGGFSATYQGNIYDGSLEHQVDKLSTMLTR